MFTEFNSLQINSVFNFQFKIRTLFAFEKTLTLIFQKKKTNEHLKKVNKSRNVHFRQTVKSIEKKERFKNVSFHAERNKGPLFTNTVFRCKLKKQTNPTIYT